MVCECREEVVFRNRMAPARRLSGDSWIVMMPAEVDNHRFFNVSSSISINI